jgi:hypothetical protein
METENKFNDENIREANLELGRPQGATPSQDIAEKAEDVSSNDKTAPTTTTTTENHDEEFDHEYISGLKLFLVITAVTLVFFLMMLDMSIIVTVGSAISHAYSSTLSKNHAEKNN